MKTLTINIISLMSFFTNHLQLHTITVLLVLSISVYSQDIVFVKSTQPFNSENTNSIGLADFNNNSSLDAVFANMGFVNSLIWFNNGEGYFTNSGQTLTQQGHGVGLGDFDNDGDIDLFIPCASYEVNNILYSKPSKIYFNDGAGNFSDSFQNIGDSVHSGVNINIIDVDYDNDLDAHIIYYSIETQNFYHKVYLNDGIGFFELSGINLPENKTLCWADFDNDGDADYFTAETGIGFTLMQNQGNGTFIEYWSMDDATLLGNSFGTGDIDNDVDFDVIVTNGFGANQQPTKIFVNDGTGSFILSEQELSNTGKGRIAIGDIDIDGSLDIVLTNCQGVNHVWINDDNGNFILSAVLSGNGAMHSPNLGDIDSDGDLDLVIANYFTGQNEIWFNETVTLIKERENFSDKILLDSQLFQNYPNPFKTSTTIQFNLQNNSIVDLSIYNLFGQKIKTLINDYLNPGNKSVVWDGTDSSGKVVSEGVYCCRIQVGNHIISKKILFSK